MKKEGVLFVAECTVVVDRLRLVGIVLQKHVGAIRNFSNINTHSDAYADMDSINQSCTNSAEIISNQKPRRVCLVLFFNCGRVENTSTIARRGITKSVTDKEITYLHCTAL